MLKVSLATSRARRRFLLQTHICSVDPCRDPSGTILAFADMMKKKIVMPAHMMDDHEHMPKTGRGLFSDFSAVAQSTGTYTAVVCSNWTF